MDEFAIGASFAEHVIRGVAGRGGMGIVYRAMHVPLKREVALKVIAPNISADEEVRARFRNEFEAAASIQHPNVIPIYHAGEEDGLLYVTMRYVQGEDLARLVAMETRLEPVRAAVIIAQVAAALDAAHARGLVHRDVKPANVLIEGRGELENALLTDFGLTKSLQSDNKMTKTGTVIGTFDYTAPEQLEGRAVDARTDVYALGCVFFQTLTGRVPFPRDTLGATLFAHFEAAPPSVTALVPEAPATLDEVIATAMAKDPAARYQSAGDLARAALAAVDQHKLAGGMTLLAAGERPSGWNWPAATQAPGEGGPLQSAPGGHRAARRGRAAAERAGHRDRERPVRRPPGCPRAPAGALRTREGGRPPGRAGLRRARDRQVAAGLRDRPRGPRGGCHGALRALGRRVARPLPAVRDRRPALHGPPRLARAAPRTRARAVRARAPGSRAAPPPARAARAARRGRRDAALPALRGRHAHPRPGRERVADRARARRPAVGRQLHRAAAGPHAPGRRGDAAAGRGHG